MLKILGALVAPFFMVVSAAAADLPCADPAAYTIEVLAFEPRIDTTKSFADISAMRGGEPLFGATMVAAYGSIQGCRITVGFKDPVIYIARELAANTCTRAFIQMHEDGHVEIYREALARLPGRIKALIPGLGPMGAIKAAYDEIRAHHAEHDSDGEYARNRKACSGQILALTLS